MGKCEQIMNESVSNAGIPVFFSMENEKLCRFHKNALKNSENDPSTHSTTTKNGMCAREKQFWKKEPDRLI